MGDAAVTNAGLPGQVYLKCKRDTWKMMEEKHELSGMCITVTLFFRYHGGIHTVIPFEFMHKINPFWSFAHIHTP